MDNNNRWCVTAIHKGFGRALEAYASGREGGNMEGERGRGKPKLIFCYVQCHFDKNSFYDMHVTRNHNCICNSATAHL